MIKRIIYVISILSIILLSFLLIEMLVFIFEAGWQGLMFLFIVIIALMLELFLLIYKKNYLINSYIYNLSISLLTIYVSYLYYKIYSYVYQISIRYLKNNYLFLSIVFIFVLVNCVIGVLKKNRKDL